MTRNGGAVCWEQLQVSPNMENFRFSDEQPEGEADAVSSRDEEFRPPLTEEEIGAALDDFVEMLREDGEMTEAELQDGRRWMARYMRTSRFYEHEQRLLERLRKGFPRQAEE